MSSEALSSDEQLSASDAEMLVYFWEEKEDLERYTGWEALRPKLQRHHPEILKAWADYQASRFILSATLRLVRELAEKREHT